MKLTEKDIKTVFNKDGDAEITILNGDDAGITFKYGKVAIDETEEGPSMSFGYEVLSGTPVNKDAFVDSIAHLLHEMILFQLEQGTVQYSGGVDTPGAVTIEEKPVIEEERMIPKIGEFRAKKGETAMSFLDNLAAQGMAQMKR